MPRQVYENELGEVSSKIGLYQLMIELWHETMDLRHFSVKDNNTLGTVGITEA